MMPPKLQLLAVVAFAVAMLFLENQIQKLEESRAKLGEAAERCAGVGLAGGHRRARRVGIAGHSEWESAGRCGAWLGGSRGLGPRHVGLPPPGREAAREVSGRRAAPSALLGERGPKSAWSWSCWRMRTLILWSLPSRSGKPRSCAARETGI